VSLDPLDSTGVDAFGSTYIIRNASGNPYVVYTFVSMYGMGMGGVIAIGNRFEDVGQGPQTGDRKR
jgi:hypothetical protein